MSVSLDHPLRFEPVLKDYIWGGRRLAQWGKQLGPGDHWAESWEVADHGTDQTRVLAGPWAGKTLHELLQTSPEELTGSARWERFPLLLKLLDAHDRLSVQVHPNDEQAARLQPPDWGKTEAWIVLEAQDEAVVWAGLQPGVDRNTLLDHLQRGTVEQCLHRQPVRVGDCILLPAGVVHAIGPGLVLAEIQQASNTTFRLFDWNRVGPDGKPRALHIQEALAVIDFEHGPVRPQLPRPGSQEGEEILAECSKFVVRRHRLREPRRFGGDGRFHILLVIEGQVSLARDPLEQPLSKGHTALIPAAAPAVQATPEEHATLLHFHLP